MISVQQYKLNVYEAMVNIGEDYEECFTQSLPMEEKRHIELCFWQALFSSAFDSPEKIPQHLNQIKQLAHHCMMKEMWESESKEFEVFFKNKYGTPLTRPVCISENNYYKIACKKIELAVWLAKKSYKEYCGMRLPLKDRTKIAIQLWKNMYLKFVYECQVCQKCRVNRMLRFVDDAAKYFLTKLLPLHKQTSNSAWNYEKKFRLNNGYKLTYPKSWKNDECNEKLH
jgi:hypothetical protein